MEWKRDQNTETERKRDRQRYRDIITERKIQTDRDISLLSNN